MDPQTEMQICFSLAAKDSNLFEMPGLEWTSTLLYCKSIALAPNMH